MSTPALPCPNCNHPSHSHYAGNNDGPKGCAVTRCICQLSIGDIERRATSRATNLPDDAPAMRAVANATPSPLNTSDTEKVNHPPHYGGDTHYEVIKVLEAWGLDDFCLGNVIKYIARHAKKHAPPAIQLEDLKKAQWYLNRRIEQLSSRQS